ncbi:MAG: ABC transporter ATP-binding protein/permease [Burkholderiales bacterium]|nr:ABC transporter ATP-binding protein/permease [Burkholderiales bacterium]
MQAYIQNDSNSLTVNNKPVPLLAGERVLARLETDLDERLHFKRGELVLTSERLLFSSSLGSANAALPAVQTWPLGPGLSLAHFDHGGVGSLNLLDSGLLQTGFRFTLGQNLQALKLVKAFTDLQNLQTSEQVTEPVDEDELGDDAVTVSQGSPTWALLKLWRFARPYKWQLFLGFFLTLASTAATMVPPYLTMPLMDEVLIPFQNGAPIDFDKVSLYLSGLLGAALFAWILGWAKTYILALVSERIGADLRTTTYEHLLQLSLQYFGGKRTGDLMARIGSESDRICVVRDRLRHGFEKIDRIWSEVTNVLADTIPGIRVVKAFAQEKREVERFRSANRSNLQVNDKVNRVWSLFSPTVTLLTETGLLVVWGFGVWQISRNEITVGVLTAFLAYIGRFYTRLDSMSRIVSVTQKAAAGAKRIFEILDHVSSVPEPVNPLPMPEATGAIELRNIGFRYGSRSVIRDVSLNIKPGEMIGLVGHSGSGKSTLVNLICRFYDVSEGSILLDGRDVRQISLTDFRRHFGLVLQEPFLFYGTIAENIAYGRPNASRAEIVAAARAAHAHDFILRLPLGYDSLVGERGQSLSGGERQRISIARALLINPKILVLDEATSSVDTTTEKEIQKALDNLTKGRTTIAIAHRLSTLRKADRLVVLDRGEIVEEGSHEVLMAKEGAYHTLYQAQARRAEELGEWLPESEGGQQ